ncbi:AAA family ATPase [Pseudooceanicola marinus]|uniref:AAA family ATPase n=1 Tax=Pseudooceanicola marinus TaxID=396013 RepID=UPI001CD5794D|nr:pilus assembly protein CpaE [Pseudooceanicola marinus]MCA1336681.1 pilus assembly protein CpaE [Pseudooceanicola marinus]
MSASATLQAEPSPIVACTIRREPDGFELLIEDMETVMGDKWGDLGFAEALMFFNQPEAETLEFIAMAIDSEDEENLVLLGEVITQARAQGIKVILIAEDVSPAALHQLLRKGADEFVPYPLPENELAAAISRIQQPDPEPETEHDGHIMARTGGGKGDRNGAVLVCHGLSGGSGATTLAVNIAYELSEGPAKSGKKRGLKKKAPDAPPPKVCLLDLDLQYGSVGTYLDLPRREAVYELLSDTEAMDADVFRQALLGFEDRISVLTAPTEMLPLDLITQDDVQRIIDMARSHFDFVIIDMPKTIVQWTETVLNEAQVYFALIEMDMRSAQNTQRLKRALQAEELPVEKLRYVLNRAPKFTDLSGRQRVKRLAETLDIAIELQFPDGGRQVTQGADHGVPLGAAIPKNPLRREIQKLAQSLLDLDYAAAEEEA